MTRKQLAAYLSCSSATVSRLLANYKPTYKKIPNKGKGEYDYNVSAVQLEAMKQQLEENKVGAPRAREYSMEIFKVF